MEPTEWRELVGRKIEARRQELSIRSKRQAARAAGFNEAVWRQLESGRRQIAKGQFVAPTPTPETKAAASRVLGWTADSIDRLIGGLLPLATSEAPPDALASGHGGSSGWPPWLEEQFRVVREEIQAVARELTELRSDVEAIQNERPG